jgi:hypothetical protein
LKEELGRLEEKHREILKDNERLGEENNVKASELEEKIAYIKRSSEVEIEMVKDEIQMLIGEIEQIINETKNLQRQ